MKTGKTLCIPRRPWAAMFVLLAVAAIACSREAGTANERPNDQGAAEDSIRAQTLDGSGEPPAPMCAYLSRWPSSIDTLIAYGLTPRAPYDDSCFDRLLSLVDTGGGTFDHRVLVLLDSLSHRSDGAAAEALEECLCRLFSMRPVETSAYLAQVANGPMRTLLVQGMQGRLGTAEVRSVEVDTQRLWCRRATDGATAPAARTFVADLARDVGLGGERR